MALNILTNTFPWARYSKKLIAKIEKPYSAGSFTAKEASDRTMRLAEGVSGSIEKQNLVKLYWLVDKDDGIIVDARFQVFGQTALMGAAEVACELVIGKNYDQAKRLTTLIIDQQVRDKSEEPGFPPEASMHLNLVLEAIEMAAEQCQDLPLAANYVAPPMSMDNIEVREGGYPGWLQLSVAEKLAVIEEVLNQDIRPYIALDAGGVDVLNLIEGNEVIIAYKGTCTSCYSSVGTTLSYIQQVLRAKVYPTLVVTPNL